MISMKQLFAGAGVVALTSATAAASVPLSFTHQGILRENGALVNDVRTINAVITDSPLNNGTELGRSVQDVKVESGLYTMTISDIDADGVAAADRLYLHVTVNDEPMEPALEISAVPYALASHVAESVKTTAASGRGLYIYHIISDKMTSNPDADETACPCDKDVQKRDCDKDTFTDTYFDSAFCFDQSDGVYFHYEREQLVHPLNTLVIQDSTIGIGTAEPEAPLHIRAMQGAGVPEIIVADTEPEIYLEDLDGDDQSVYKMSLNDGELAVSAVAADGQAEQLLVINNGGLNINGTLKVKALDGAVKIGNDNFTEGSIDGSKIAGGTLDGSKVTAGTLPANSLKDAYPAKAFATVAGYNCTAATECVSTGGSVITRRFAYSCTETNVLVLSQQNIKEIKVSERGIYTVSFINALATADYSVVLSYNSVPSEDAGNPVTLFAEVTDKATTGFKIKFKKRTTSISSTTDETDGTVSYSLSNSYTAYGVNLSYIGSTTTCANNRSSSLAEIATDHPFSFVVYE